MNADGKIALIDARLRAAFAPSVLEVIDESDQHIGHAGHQGGGKHFHVRISAAALNAIPKVAAHREIYSLVADLMPTQIHALRITIIK